jgi:hypothetical protein
MVEPVKQQDPVTYCNCMDEVKQRIELVKSSWRGATERSVRPANVAARGALVHLPECRRYGGPSVEPRQGRPVQIPPPYSHRHRNAQLPESTPVAVGSQCERVRAGIALRSRIEERPQLNTSRQGRLFDALYEAPGHPIDTREFEPLH